jgi:XTP/dITP diphosphohydrolase
VRTLCVATRNRHKLAEIRAVLGSLGLAPPLLSCIDFPGCPEVTEDGATLAANAAKKAREVCLFTGLLTLADDTGLEVEALDGAPGVVSARWAGPGCSYADNNAKLLRALADVPESHRTARFRCVVALAAPGAPGSEPRVQLFEGRLDGRIATAGRGTGGFGYDPVFWVDEAGCTLAELSEVGKNSLSHRARALAAVRAALEIELGPRA